MSRRPGHRPADTDHPLCGDIWRRRVQEHQRRRHLERRQHRPDQRRCVYALAIDPLTPTTLYAGTYGGGVFKSTDGGASWSAVNTGLTNSACQRPGHRPADPEHALRGDFGQRRVPVVSSRHSGWPPSFPASRSVQVGTPATAFVTIINAGAGDGHGRRHLAPDRDPRDASRIRRRIR